MASIMDNLQPQSIHHIANDISQWRNILTDQYDSSGKLLKTAAERFNDMYAGKDASYLLTPDEVLFVQSTIQNVLRWGTLANENIPGVGQFCPVKNIGEGMTSLEWYKWLDVLPPRMTQTFEGGADVKPLKTLTTNKLYGMDYDFHLDKVTADASKSSNGKVKLQPDLQMGILQNLTESLNIYREWFIWRGTDIANGTFTDIGITGLVNDANLTDPGALGAGADDDLTAAGDVYLSGVKLANKLIQAKFKPPFVLDLTPKVFSQATYNINATNSKSDWTLLNEFTFGGSKVFAAIRPNPFLIHSATETTSTGAMACYKPGMENFFTAESYGLGYYPMPPHGLGVDGKLLWMGRSIVTRPTAIQYADALTTNQ